MKIQIESIERLESIFSELAEEGEGHRSTPEEIAVLLQIKSLFLKNVEIAGETLGIKQLAAEDTEEKRKHAHLVAQIEEAEAEKAQKIKELCSLRRDLPERLRQEVERGYNLLRERLESAPLSRSSPVLVQPEEEIKEISRNAQDLIEALPRLSLQIRENIQSIEQDIKDRSEENSRVVETESLSLLFKDELELQGC